MILRRCLGIALVVLAQTSSAWAGNHDVRVGIQFLGSGFLAAYVEEIRGDASLRFSAGVFEPEEICLTATANVRYREGEVQPFVGMGVFQVLGRTKRGFGGLTFLSFRTGADVLAQERGVLGMEVDAHRFMTGHTPGGGPVTFRKDKRTIILPGLTAGRRLE